MRLRNIATVQISTLGFFAKPPGDFIPRTHVYVQLADAHIHTHTHIYIYIYMSVCAHAPGTFGLIKNVEASKMQAGHCILLCN